MSCVGMGSTAKKMANGSHQIVSVPMSQASTPFGRGMRRFSLVYERPLINAPSALCVLCEVSMCGKSD